MTSHFSQVSAAGLSGGKSLPVQVLLSYSVATIPCMAFFFSPLVSWGLSLGILATLSEHITSRPRALLGIVAVMSGAAMLASRAYGVVLSDDFLQYYEMYRGLANREWDYLFGYGGGLEIGLGLVFVVLSVFLGPSNPSTVMFSVMLLSGGIFLVWLETYGLRYTSPGKRGLLMAYSILFFSFFFATQTVRQVASSGFLLLALFEHRRRLAYAFLALATVFHLSAIPVYLFFAAIRRWRWRGVLLGIAVVYLAATQFSNLIQYAVGGGVEFFGSDKFMIYADGFQGFTEADLGPLRWMFAALLIGIVAKIVERAGRRDHTEVFPVFVAFFFLHIVLLPIPLAPLRATLLVSSVALGWFIFMFCENIQRAYLKAFFLVALVWKAMGFLSQQSNDPFLLWTQYDWYGFLPGYFWL